MTSGRSGLVLLDKPADLTSFQALNSVKDAVGTRRVGHTGTIDRFATGLLVVLVGTLTRLAVLFSELDKSYRARVVFGAETDTLDPEGAVVARGPIPDLRTLEQACRGFIGTTEQIPPAYSAVHIQGRRAHELSRAGAAPEMRPRRVEIRRLEITGYDPPELELEVECSKGTYVRSLARDLALSVGSRAHLKQLRRVTVGPFRVEEAQSPSTFDPARHVIPPSRFLQRLEGVRCLTVGADEARDVRQGRSLESRLSREVTAEGRILAIFDAADGLLAVARREGERARYLAVFQEDGA